MLGIFIEKIQDIGFILYSHQISINRPITKKLAFNQCISWGMRKNLGKI